MYTTVLSQALRLAELGFAIHWLRPRSKVPISEGWQSKGPADYLPAALHLSYRPGFNVGICTGRARSAYNLVVLDIDDAAAKLLALRTVTASPLRVTTSRGEQWYYLHPGPDLYVPSRARIDGYHLDLRAELGQVVCPPSIHPSGSAYLWQTEPTAALLSALPAWSPQWFPLPQPLAQADQPALTSRYSGAAEVRAYRRGQARARRWPVAEESHGRGTQTFLLAGILVCELGLSPELAYGILAAEYNPRLPQPYDERLLRRKVAETQKIRARARLLHPVDRVLAL